jgi:uncharacterized protein YqeY
MLRDDVGDALKSAMKARDTQATSTLRMILAAIKDRDIAARGQGQAGGIGDAEVVKVLQSMVKQRQESIELYRKGGRQDLVDKETQEIAVIQRFLPEQMTAAEMEKAVADAARELGATGLKDMGRTMALLRERHGGRMDFAQAGAQLKKLLGAT